MDIVLIVVIGVLALIMAGIAMSEHSTLVVLRRRLAADDAAPKPLTVPAATSAELEGDLKRAYEAKITEATATFGTDLQATSTRLSEQVSRLTTNVIEDELTAYQQTLEEVRKTATEAMAKIRAAVDEQRTELKKSMEEEVAADRDRLVAKFDTKLGDIVASYIAESLGGGVDLGAQMQFITQSLEAHKADIKADLTHGI